MSSKAPDEKYSDKEAQRRFETALRTALNTPPKPQSEMKLGKRKVARKSATREKPRRAKSVASD